MRTATRARSGKIALLALLVLPVCLAFGTLAVDRGLLATRHSEAQNGADAVAYAAAGSLDGTSEGIARAYTAAEIVGQRNFIGTSSISSSGTEGAQAVVELGRWDDDTFVADTSDPSTVTSARAVITRSDIRTVFAPVPFGQWTMAVQAEAVAVAGGVGGVDCPLPIAVPDCSVEDLEASCGSSLVLNADKVDTAGWAQIGSTRPSATTVRSALRSCGLGTVTTNDIVTLNNGTISNGLQTLATVINGSTTTWDADELGTIPSQSGRSGVTHYGNVLEGWILVFDDPSDCSATSYSGSSLPITGFVQVVVYDVDTTGPVSSRAIYARMGCGMEDDAQGGGSFYGSTVPPRFVSTSG